jgi:hypothetical protein
LVAVAPDPALPPHDNKIARASIATLASLATLITAWQWLDVVHPDWIIARTAGQQLLSPDALSVYRDHPRAQMGPLALALATLPRPLYIVLICAAVAPCLYWFTGAARAYRTLRPRRAWSLLALGGVLVVVPWSQLAWKGHGDDALVLLGAALLVHSMAGKTRWGVLLGLAVAVAGKPTAFALIPLVMTAPIEAIAGLLVLAAIWGPFLVADPGALVAAGRGVMTVGRGSLPDYLSVGVGSAPPPWIRPVQLASGLAATTIGAVRDRPLEGLLLCFTVRALVDPNPAPAYSIPLVVIAVAVDLRLSLPVTLPLAAASFWPVPSRRPGRSLGDVRGDAGQAGS